MAYEVLARKYRPETFADLTGQQVVTDTLRHAIQGEAVGTHSFTVCMIGTVAFAALMFALGTYVVTRRSARNAV